MVLGGLRALFTPPAGGIRAADHPMGAGCLEQLNSPIGALHRVRRQGRNPTAPGLARHGSRLEAVFGLGPRGACQLFVSAFRVLVFF
jgi:hypothetical protein